MLDLGEQYGLERRLARNIPLKRPPTLQDFVVAIGEEHPRTLHRARVVGKQCAEAIIQDSTPIRKTNSIRRKLVQAWKIERIERAILKRRMPHAILPSSISYSGKARSVRRTPNPSSLRPSSD